MKPKVVCLCGSTRFPQAFERKWQQERQPRSQQTSQHQRKTMNSSAAAKNLERIAQSVEHHDSKCESKAKAVCLCPFEFERLGFSSITLKNGRSVPIKADDSLGTGSLRVVCDGYHGPKKEKEQEETVEAPAPSERELVPAGAPSVGPGDPWPHRGGPKS